MIEYDQKPPMNQDFVQIAATQTREAFVAAFPHPFLVGEGVLHQPVPGRTMMFESGNTVSTDEQSLGKRDLARRLVLPVRKVHVTFPSMITIGRTRNNDIVLPDALISKFHAFFRLVDGHHELADAGSQNGTRINDDALVPKGPGVRLRSNDLVQFAELRFRFFDAAACWQALRAH